jgi:hypothetical protein
MSSSEFSTDIVGRKVLDARGERIGHLASLYLDTDTGTVSFAGVAMLRHGRRRLVFVPLADATVGPSAVTVKCGKELARRSPSVRPGHSLPAETEPALFAHYDLAYAPAGSRPRSGRRLALRA